VGLNLCINVSSVITPSNPNLDYENLGFAVSGKFFLNLTIDSLYSPLPLSSYLGKEICIPITSSQANGLVFFPIILVENPYMKYYQTFNPGETIFLLFTAISYFILFLFSGYYFFQHFKTFKKDFSIWNIPRISLLLVTLFTLDRIFLCDIYL